MRATILPWHGVYPSYYLHLHPAVGRQFREGTYAISLSRPHAGVWAIALTNDAARREPGGPVEAADYAMDVAVRGATITARPADIHRLAVTIAQPQGALLKPALTVADANVAARQRTLGPDGLPALFPLDVPTDTGVLRVSATSAQHGDLDLHLYNCSSGECFSHEFTFAPAASPSISVRRPATGRWIAAISSPRLPGRTIGVALESMMTRGTGTELDLPARPEPGAPWRVTIDRPARALFFELFDRAMEQDEAEHAWENRPGVMRLTDRPVPLGTHLHRFD